MPDERTARVPVETKGVAEQFVGALGLLDLIVGGLALYWVRLAYGDRIAPYFPATGISALDVALVACAASLIGKTIDIVIAFVQAVVEMAIVSRSRYVRRLQITLRTYCERAGFADPPEGVDVGELAADYVAIAAPSRFSNLERVRSTVTLAYGASLLAILYVTYLRNQVASLGRWLWVVPVVFGLLGYLQHLNYYQTLEVSLSALVPRTSRRPEEC